MSLLRSLLFAIVLLVFGACKPEPLPGQEIQTVVYKQLRIIPSPLYQYMYAEMERCTGIKGNFGGVKWFIAEGITVEYQDGTRAWASGLWRKIDGISHIVIRRDHYMSGETVSHEILHDLYQGDVPLDVSDHCMLTWKTSVLFPIPRPALSDSLGVR